MSSRRLSAFLAATSVFGLLLLLPSCSSRSLGSYKGLLKDLLPASVKTYTKNYEWAPGLATDIPAQWNPPKDILSAEKELGLLEYRSAAYNLAGSSSDNSLLILLMNFDSAQGAVKALNMAKASLLKDPDASVNSSGEKKKGWSNVGERLELQGKGFSGKPIKTVYWTNGSVLVGISSWGLDMGHVTAFEDALPY